MSQTLERVRAKFPAYANRSDEELALAIARKFPVYLERDPEFADEVGRYQADLESQGAREEKKAQIRKEGQTPFTEPESTPSKAYNAFIGQMGQGVGQPIQGARRIAREGGSPVMSYLSMLPGANLVSSLADEFAEGGQAAMEVAEATPGSEAVSDITGALGSGLGTAALTYPISVATGGVGGPAIGATISGLQSFEQTAQEAQEMLERAGMPPEQAKRAAFRIGLKAGAITGAVTGVVGKYGGKIGLGEGAEQTVKTALRKMASEELRKGIGKDIAKKVLKEGLGEATEEGTDTLLQEALVTWEYDPTQTLESAIRKTFKAAYLGGVAGVGVGAPFTAAHEFAARREASKAQAVRGAVTRVYGEKVVDELEKGEETSAPIEGVKEALEQKPEEPLPPAGKAGKPPVKPVEGQEPAREPGVYLHLRGPQGEQDTFVLAPGESEAIGRTYLERVMPDWQVERVERVEALESQEGPPAGELGEGEVQEVGSQEGAPTGERPSEPSEPDPMPFSLGEGAEDGKAVSKGEGAKVAEVRKALEEEMGGPLPDSIEVIDDPDFGVEQSGHQAKGNANLDTGKVIINAAAHRTPQDAKRTLRHELLHLVWGSRKLFEAWNRVAGAMRKERIGKERARYSDQGEPVVAEEASVEEVLELADKVPRGVIDRFLQTAAKLVRKVDPHSSVALFGTDRVTHDDAKQLIAYAYARVKAGRDAKLEGREATTEQREGTETREARGGRKKRGPLDTTPKPRGAVEQVAAGSEGAGAGLGGELEADEDVTFEETPSARGRTFNAKRGKGHVELAVAETDPEGGDRYYASDLTVRGESEDVRGQGIGTDLYFKALRWVQQKGAGWKSDSILSDQAQAIYERLKEQGIPFRKVANQYVLDPQTVAQLDLSEREVREVTASDVSNAIFESMSAHVMGIKHGGDKSGFYVAIPPDEEEESHEGMMIGPFETREGADRFLESEVGAPGASVVELDAKKQLVSSKRLRQSRGGKVPRHDIDVAAGRPISDGDPASVPGAKREQQIAYAKGVLRDFAKKGRYGKIMRPGGVAVELDRRLAPLLKEYGISRTTDHTLPDGRVQKENKSWAAVVGELTAAIDDQTESPGYELRWSKGHVSPALVQAELMFPQPPRKAPRAKPLESLDPDTRVVAARISTELNRKAVNPYGMKAGTEAERRGIAGLFRNPRVETMQWFLVKNGKVLRTISISTRLAGSVYMYHPKLFTIEDVARDVVDIGADSYFISHNHPSGTVDPSGADVVGTQQLTQRLAVAVASRAGFSRKFDFLGHYVINHDKYARIEAQGQWAIHDIAEKQGVADPLLNKGTPEVAAIGSIVTLDSDGSVAAAKAYHTPGRVLTFLALDPRLRVRAVVQMPLDWTHNQIEAELEKVKKNYGATQAFGFFDQALTPKDAQLGSQRLQQLYDSHVLLDAASPIHPRGMQFALLNPTGARPDGTVRMSKEPDPTAQTADVGDQGIRWKRRVRLTPEEKTLVESAKGKQAAAKTAREELRKQGKKDEAKKVTPRYTAAEQRAFDKSKGPTTSPELERLLSLFPVTTRGKLSQGDRRALVDLIDTLPDAQEMSLIARMGEAGRKWYQLGKAVLEAASGPADFARFAGVVASTSPNKEVLDNVKIALQVWKLWNDAKRPTDKNTLIDLLWRFRDADGKPTGKGPRGRITEGPGVTEDKGRPIYLESDLGNTIASLSGEKSDTHEDILARMSASSPKVRPFYRAVLGFLDAVVNDTWMARYFGIPKEAIKNPNKNQAATMITKDAARILGWEPAEVQAAVWAVARVIGDRILAELQSNPANRRRMSEIVDQEITVGQLMPGDDFATLLVKGQYFDKEKNAYVKFSDLAKEAGLNVSAAETEYDKFVAQHPRSPGEQIGSLSRGAGGPVASEQIGRRFEEGYRQAAAERLRKGETKKPVPDKLRWRLGGMTPPLDIVSPTLDSAPAVEAEVGRQTLARKAVTPFQSELAHVGLHTWLDGHTLRSDWGNQMRAIYGDAVTPHLNRAWEDLGSTRWALGQNMNAQTVADVARINQEVAMAEAVEAAKDEPTPVYDVSKVEKGWMKLWRPSTVVRYFGSDQLLRQRQLMEVRTAYQAAATRRVQENLMTQLEKSYYGSDPNFFTKFLRRWAPKPKLERFLRYALPIAAHLNVNGGRSTAWTYNDFEMRAGFMPEPEAKRQGLTTGGQVAKLNPVTGAQELLNVGPRIELENGRKGFQLTRTMTPERQEGIYKWMWDEFPEFGWLVDMWVDPRLSGAKMKVGDVEVPVFNRHALSEFYKAGDPKFDPREAYTPNVLLGGIGGGLVRQFRKRAQYNVRAGNVSPGRKYDTGAARESGNVMDLVSGFSVRTMQVLQEKTRTEWTREVLNAAQDVPPEGVPEGWVSLETAMSQVWRAVQLMRKFDSPLDYPQMTERFRDDESPEYQKFFGELLRMRAADAPKIVPEPLVKVLMDQFATAGSQSGLARVLRWWGRSWKSALLLMPDTFLENRTDNYMRLLMQGYRQTILSALQAGRGGDWRLPLREAKHLVWSSLVNIVPLVRPSFGLNDNELFNNARLSSLPDELFSGGTSLRELQVYQDSVQNEVAGLRAVGRRKEAAALVMLNLPSIVLEETGYGDIDVRAKQQYAFSVLFARAEHEAWRNKLTGQRREAFIEQFVLHPPEDVVRLAVAGANRALLNYQDTPGWVGAFARMPLLNTVVAFPLFRYHFVGREIDRATSLLRGMYEGIVRGRKMSAAEKAGLLADFISYWTLPAMGYAVSHVVAALSDSIVGALLGGGDDDEPDDIRNYIGSSVRIDVDPLTGEIERKKLPRELVTSNRLNFTRMLEAMGIPHGDTGADLWLMYKDYPVVRGAAVFAQAMDDTRRHGPEQGFLTIFTAFKDLAMSLTGVGQALKVPARLLEEYGSKATGADTLPGFLDPYGASVPLRAYMTLQFLNLLPAQRQADELIKWLDPTPRRITKSKYLDYDPGVVEALESGGWTGLAHRAYRKATTGSFSSPLPPQGTINRKTGTVDEPRSHSLTERLGGALGIQAKEIPRSEYMQTLEEGQ